jgi:cytochrome P450
VQLYNWTYRPAQFLETCQARYGDTFTIRLPRFAPIVVVSRPVDVKQVFMGDPEQFAAGEANTMLKPALGGHSLLLLDGECHRVERKLLMPALHGERMQAYSGIIRDAARRVFGASDGADAWPSDQYVSVHARMKQITRAVILKAVFGQEQGDGLQQLPELMDACVRFGHSPLFLAVVDQAGDIRASALQERTRFSPWSKFRRLHDAVDALLYREIARRRATPGQRQDVMSLLLTAKDEAGRPLDDEAVRDEMLSLLVAGHKTTAAALTWCIYRLLTEPRVYELVRQEVVQGQHDYLDRVIKESLRLNPTLPIVLRRLKSSQRIGEHDLPAGVLAAPAIHLVHRRADCWPDPERFNPDRFTSKVSPYKYFPFGGGPRRCIGMAFALHEMRIVVSELISSVVLELEPGYRARTVRSGITFVISDGLPARRAMPLPRSGLASGPQNVASSSNDVVRPADGARAAAPRRQ